MLRKATPDDIPQIVEIAHLMMAEGSFVPLEVDPDRIANFLDALVSHGFVAVVEKEGVIVGGIMGDVVTPWYGKKRIGVEYAVYLLPEHRHGLTAARMVQSWVKWCKQNQAVQCRAGVTTGNNSLERLYVALGFTRCGGSYVLNF